MSPLITAGWEQLGPVRSSRDVDARADVWALGVILYEAASGRKLFQADTLLHLAVLICEATPTPLRELRPDLPDEFLELVDLSMVRDRERRLATVSEMGQRLARLRDKPPCARGVPESGPSEPAAPLPAVGVAPARFEEGVPSASPSGSDAARTSRPVGRRLRAWMGATALGLIAGAVIARSLWSHLEHTDRPLSVPAPGVPLSLPYPSNTNSDPRPPGSALAAGLATNLVVEVQGAGVRFKMDRTEATVGQYAACVASNACRLPVPGPIDSSINIYGQHVNPGQEHAACVAQQLCPSHENDCNLTDKRASNPQYPMNCVDQSDAGAFCSSRSSDAEVGRAAAQLSALDPGSDTRRAGEAARQR